MLAPCAVAVLHGQHPIPGSTRSSKSPRISREAMPGSKAVQNLPGIEDRWSFPILRDLSGGERARSELNAEQEFDAARGAVPRSAESFAFQCEQSGYDIACRLGVR